ncbi:MAG: DNA replication/repair protein RecF [Candidatus Gracilibacteria bacterium]|jgi:DNA replication and repair protein RecF
MKLHKLQLENFRNYENYSYKFKNEKLITVFTGKNGSGKTNLLEAIYVLSLGRSFRNIKQEDMIGWEKDFLRVKGDVEEHENIDASAPKPRSVELTELEVFYGRAPSRKKSFKRNGVPMKTSSYIGALLTVFFHPEDLNMLYLEPSLRRRYMDILLSQTNKKYLAALMEYKKVLKQRNALLQEIRENKFNNIDNKTLYDDLAAWNKQMAEFGSIIIKNRLDLVWILNRMMTQIYQSISGGKEKIEVKYANNVLKESAMVPTMIEGDTDDLTIRKIANLYEKKLTSMEKIEEIQGKTLTGPHRDDLVFYIDDREIVTSASRGEIRTLLLAIKLAEIEFIRRITKTNPLLLLDDVFSELDIDRQKKLFSAIDGCQTIITTTEPVKDSQITQNAEFVEF